MAWGYLSVARTTMMLFRPFDEFGPPTIAAMEHALALDPEQSEGLTVKAMMAYTDTNDTAALDSLMGSIPSAVKELAAMKALIARSYAIRGDEAKARKIFVDLVASSDSLTPLALMDTASLAIALGEIDESVNLMERVEKGGSWMQFWSKLMSLKSGALRDNPRYQALLKRMGLDDESVKALNERMSFK